MNKLISLIQPQIFFWSAVASIIALAFTFIEDAQAILIASICFNFILIALGVRLWYVMNMFVTKTHDSEFATNSGFMRYYTEDGKKITYESYKHIQCKRLLISEIKNSFKWSGRNQPITITSNLQKIESIKYNSQDEFDYAVLKFTNPLIYNQTAMLHFKAEYIDDESSRPELLVNIHKPVDLIQFRVELRNKPSDYETHAYLKRRRIGINNLTDFNICESVAFDHKSKSYEYHLLKPEIGYCYKLEWEK